MGASAADAAGREFHTGIVRGKMRPTEKLEINCIVHQQTMHGCSVEVSLVSYYNL